MEEKTTASSESEPIYTVKKYKGLHPFLTCVLMLLYFVTFFLCVMYYTPVWAQKKRLDLDDLAIKGELIGEDRLNILNREQNNLKNYVKFRLNYRAEIMEGLPTPVPGVR